MSRYLTAIALLLVAAGCSGLTQHRADRTALPQGVFGLPAPSELRTASYVQGKRSASGDQYESALPSSHIQVSGTSLQFAAASGPAAAADLAFAMYELDGMGYSGQGLLGIDWAAAPPSNGVWVGLANWTDNRWDWMLTPPTEETDLGAYADYVDVVSGHILITVLSTLPQSLTLDNVHFGTPGLEPPTNVVATDGDFPDHVGISWDAPAAGPAPVGYSVWRSDLQNGVYSLVGNAMGVTTYDDPTAVLDTFYWYKVRSTKTGESDSAFSGENDGFATAGGFGWTITTAALLSGQDPQQLSLGLVNGHPAMAWGRTSAGIPVSYRHAEDAAGAVWSDPVVNLDANSQEPNVGFFNNVPAVSAAGTAAGPDLKFRHGSDADGNNAWGGWSVAFDAQSQHVVSDPDLLDIGSRPAIAFRYADFQNFTGTQLCYIRASDNGGDTWPANRIIVDSGERAWNPQMILLANGNPAIIYSETDNQGSDPADILFVHATDSVGSAWSPPAKIYDLAGANDLPQMQVIVANGNPAAVFEDPASGGLLYKRATSADGSTWPVAPLVVAAAGDFYDGATTVNGKPAVAYITDGGSDVMYREANDNDGSSWKQAVLIEDYPGGAGIVTMKAFGTPEEHACMAFRVDGSQIRFARKN
jgi:hypothetical protein